MEKMMALTELRVKTGLSRGIIAGACKRGEMEYFQNGRKGAIYIKEKEFDKWFENIYTKNRS
jgi:DNA-binding transcriptional regulator GbsR (MarR family)